MDGDLFGMASPTVDSNNTASTGGYSDEPSLLDFASPPPSQDTSNGFGLLQQQQQEQPREPPQQQDTENLFDFGVTPSQPQSQEPTAVPLVDLFGGGFPSNPTPNTTPQPQSQAQPMDLFGSPASDAFAPSPSPAPASDDPFAMFLQPQAQPQAGAIGDPFLALSMPAQPTAQTTKPASKIPKLEEEEKKDQDSPPMVVLPETKQQEASVTAGAEDAGSAAPVVAKDEKAETSLLEDNAEKETNKPDDNNSESIPSSIPSEQTTIVEEVGEKLIPTNYKTGNGDETIQKVSTPPILSASNDTMPPAPEEPMPESSSDDPIVDVAIEEESQPHELDLMENEPEGASSTISTTVPSESKATTVTPQKQQQHPANSSNRLSTMTKSQTLSEKKAAIVSNRFAGFKSMAGNIAAKGAERVAKVKDQIQKEDSDGQNVKQRFAGFKNMAAERVAKVKDQIQKEDSDGNNTKQRLAGFKNMAGNIGKSVASVQVPQQLTSVQVPQRFKAAKMPMFGKGSKMMESLTNSSHGFKTAAFTEDSPSSSSPADAFGAWKASASKSSVTPNTSTSTPKVAPTDSVALKETVATNAEISTSGKPMEKSEEKSTVESKLPENDEKSSTPSQAQHISSTETETDSNANDVAESETQKCSYDDKVVSDETKVAENALATKALLPENSTTEVSPKSVTPPAKATEKAADASAKTSDNNKESVVTNPSVSKTDAKTSLPESITSKLSSETENSTATILHGTTNETNSPQTPSDTPQLSPPSKEMTEKVEALQKELRVAQTLIQQLKQQQQHTEEEKAGVMMELQANLQNEMTRRAEAEEKARVAIAKSKRIEEEYTTFKGESKSNLDELTSNVQNLTEARDAQEKELVDIREERDEQARKEMALTTRLNNAKKKEAVKANAAEHYGDQVDQLELAVKDYESQVETLTAERDQLKVELGEWKDYAEKRTKQLEMALNDEKKLNDERKRKMKGFVEAKTEEVRAAKADYISLQTELDQTSHSLTELNQRYKQLHAQWVQSQTRNRELQRDAMKMKKDSEKMHKVGGSLEARLSRSAQQSEDHKNKRIEARNELMSVLGQLEAERSVNTRLQESIKMTFTPKALSQQQTIQEALDDFDAALQKLSLRIGRPLPPTFSNAPDTFVDNTDADGIPSSALNEAENSDNIDTNDSGKPGTVTLSEINSNKAVQKLENETQRVSQNIVKFSASVERMHSLLDGGGTKSCVDVLSQILGNTTPAIAASTPTRKTGGQRYGQLSRNVP
eukprot:CAMPEP_0116112398 /NCGR_PEP_ID=MMETSP0327-20121206/18957_1 /TAXON_ID=44447 /ORGANISM="Pseudo-nitzschia delicatissima, Strain B596" /LENGTH=1260 /DNA_ID=CAMNT_0003605693 /DNA_START=143 /DNA_END=3925 /DNA_ORIENTATION=-